MEFTACDKCHAGTRVVDHVAAVFSRIFPDPRTDAERSETRALIGGMLRNVPVVRAELERLWGKTEDNAPGMAEARSVLGAGHPMPFGEATRSLLDAFTARLGMAFHCSETGSILPASGGVFVNVFTNFAATRGDIPDGLFESLGPARALIQKGLKAEEDFSFSVVRASDTDGTMSFSTFRKSIACFAVCLTDADEFLPEMQTEVFRPGFLQGYPA